MAFCGRWARRQAVGVLVEEMGTHTSLAPLHGYLPRGQRAFFKISRNRGTYTTLLLSMILEGMGPYGYVGFSD